MNTNLDSAKIKSLLLNFIVPLICLGVSLVLFIVVIYPSFSKVPELKAKLETTTNLKNQLQDKQVKLTRFIDFKGILEEDSNLVNQVMPVEQNVPGLLDQVSQIASESGLDVSKLSYSIADTSGKDADGPAYNAVLVSLGADGTYTQMITFMRAIENASRLVNISNFRFGIADSSADGRMAFTFILNAPYMDVQSTASVDDPLALDVTSSEFVTFINKVKNLRYFERSGDLTTLKVKATEEKIEEATESSESTAASGQ